MQRFRVFVVRLAAVLQVERDIKAAGQEVALNVRRRGAEADCSSVAGLSAAVIA